jgi:ABC-type multidrug transport system permease subunit
MSYPAPPPASQPPSRPPSDRQPTGNSQLQANGFFNDLFDIRFTRFVSLRLISVVYVVILAAVSLVALALVFAGFASGIGAGLFALVLAALGWVIYVVLARVALEAFAVLFRIHDDTSRVADALGGAAPPAAGTVQGYDPPGGYGGGYGQGQGQGQQGPGYPAAPQDPSNPPWV